MWKLGIGDAFFEELYLSTVHEEQVWYNEQPETMTNDQAVTVDQDEDYQPVITYGIL
jgi:hypothetical protein